MLQLAVHRIVIYSLFIQLSVGGAVCKICSHPRLWRWVYNLLMCTYLRTLSYSMAAQHSFASVVCIVAWLALYLSTVRRVRGVPVSEFYPFGAAAGDQMLDRSNDGSSQEIVLTAPFVLFGQAGDKLFVRANARLINFVKWAIIVSTVLAHVIPRKLTWFTR